jgi:hypothetical protein
MPRTNLRWTPLLLLVLLVSPPAIADDADPNVAAAANVKLTVRLAKLVDDKPTDVKAYDLVLVSGGAPSRLLSGARVPFPAGGDDGASLVYQNVGFTTEAYAWVLEDGRIKVAASIEDSRVVTPADGGPPTVETRQLSVNAVLTSGKPMEVTRVDGIRDSSGFVEIEAVVLP